MQEKAKARLERAEVEVSGRVGGRRKGMIFESLQGGASECLKFLKTQSLSACSL